MNIAIILAGGVGSRMHMDNMPKQYIVINGKRLIEYCLQTFQDHAMIEKIVIVADKEWEDVIRDGLRRNQIDKFMGFARPGRTRQFSILSALEYLEPRIQPNDTVIIHDAARPLVSKDLITACLQATEEYDGAMPVLPVKDTFYRSRDGKGISELLKREELFAGQAPESFIFGRYLACHKRMSEEEILLINGSSEIAYKNNMNILLVTGEEKNLKITTQDDLDFLKLYLEEEEGR